MNRALVLGVLLALAAPAAAQSTQNDLLTRTKNLDSDAYTAQAPTMDAALSLLSARLQVPMPASSLIAADAVVQSAEAHHDLWQRLQAIEPGSASAATAAELAGILGQLGAWRQSLSGLEGPEYRALLSLAADDLVHAIDARALHDLTLTPTTTVRLAYLEVRITALQDLHQDALAVQLERDSLQARFAADQERVARLSQEVASLTATPPALGPSSLLAFPREQQLQKDLREALQLLAPHGDAASSSAGQASAQALAQHLGATQSHAAAWMAIILLAAVTLSFTTARSTVAWHRNDRDARLGDLVGGAL